MKTMSNVPVISSSKFRYNAACRTFFTEASDFKFTNMMSQLFEDACDQGFILESVKTGRKIPFGFTGVEQDNEGEVMYMIYSAVVGSTRYELHLWND